VTSLEIIFLTAIALLVIALAFSIYFNVKHGLIILKMVDSIENTLDIMDERYLSMSQILEIPLFYDSPQIRQVLNDIEKCRNSILTSAHLLSDINVEIEEKLKKDKLRG
jgi:hypothetical protein